MQTGQQGKIVVPGEAAQVIGRSYTPGFGDQSRHLHEMSGDLSTTHLGEDGCETGQDEPQ